MVDQRPALKPPSCSICGKPTTWGTIWIDNGAVYCSKCAADVIKERFGENELAGCTPVSRRR